MNCLFECFTEPVISGDSIEAGQRFPLQVLRSRSRSVEALPNDLVQGKRALVVNKDHPAESICQRSSIHTMQDGPDRRIAHAISDAFVSMCISSRLGNVGMWAV